MGGITKGKWFYKSYDLQGGYIFSETEEFADNPHICKMADCQDKDWDEIEANANLIAEAGNVAQECGLMPRELLDAWKFANEVMDEARMLLLAIKQEGSGCCIDDMD